MKWELLSYLLLMLWLLWMQWNDICDLFKQSVGHNVRTREKISMPAINVISFKAGKVLKESVN